MQAFGNLHLSLALFVFLVDEASILASGATCPQPKDVAHGRYSLVWGRTRVVYRCDGDFILIGQASATCSWNNEWNEQPPVCVALGCPDMALMRNGRVQYLHAGGMVQFQCSPGYYLTGEKTLICDGRQWNGTQPECSRNRNAYSGNNNYIYPSRGHPGNPPIEKKKKNREDMSPEELHRDQLSEADYSCLQRSGSVPAPVIENAASHTKYAVVEQTGRLYTAYRCMWGYKHSSIHHYLYCKERRWQGEMPRCVKVVPPKRTESLRDDPNPGRRSHQQWLQYSDYTCMGRVGKRGQSPPNIRYGHTSLRPAILDGMPRVYAEYKCYDGYRLAGTNKYMYCKEDSWLGQKPTCDRSAPNSCTVNNGGCQHKCVSVGTTNKCQCHEGYVLARDGMSCKKPRSRPRSRSRYSTQARRQMRENKLRSNRRKNARRAQAQ